MGFWRREDDLERELRAGRPQPRRELVDDIARMVSGARTSTRSSRPVRLGVAIGLTAAMLAVLGSFGGLSYAANGVTHAVSSAVHVITPSKPVKFVPAPALSSSQAQYREAMCFFRHTIEVDSRLVRLFRLLGAKPGPCRGGRFQPASQLVVACFKGRNISLAKTEVNTAEKRANLMKVGIKLGYCKKT